MSATSNNEYLKQWTQRTRARLINQLGGRCTVCGTTKDLQFDHIKGRTWKMESTSQWIRIVRIKQEIAHGEIQLLCGYHNRLKG